jgi:hypothetical protein
VRSIDDEAMESWDKANRALRMGSEDQALNSTEGNDPVNHPAHYTGDPSGVECITVTENHSFCLGNVIKYCWRAGRKGDAVEDLKKARWYLDREIKRLGG